MTNAKKFWDKTKYLWIGGILGVLQQELGGLDQWLWHGHNGFRFSYILGSNGFWALAILLLIFRQKSPREQLCDILLLFVGLDFTYYLWQFVNDMQPVIRRWEKYGVNYALHLLAWAAIDFAYYTVIGALAGVWGLFATKFRSKGWKKRYTAMLVPLFLVLVLQTVGALFRTIRYYIWDYQVSHEIIVVEGYSYGNMLDGFIVSAVMLIAAAVIYRKSHRTLKRDA